MLTIINHTTSYPELVPIHNKVSELVTKKLDIAYFYYYLHYKEFMWNKRGKFIREPF